MDLKYPAFRPDPALTRSEMEELQHEIAETATFTDAFSFDSALDGVTVAGVDQAFLDEQAVSGIVVMQDGEVIEKVHAAVDLELPYIPGLLAFREGDAILAAIEQLSSDPDLLVVDGSGRIHFRQAGIATHIGVMLDQPSIGVAKKLLCGVPGRSVDALKQGERVPILADDSVSAPAETVIGYAYQSRQYPDSRLINPLYISSGHRIMAETCVDIVERLCSGYKLPEPQRRADAYVDTVKQQIRDSEQTGLSDY